MSYVVVENVSRHVSYQLNPSEKTTIYGVYDKIHYALKGLSDAVEIFKMYNFTEETDMYYQTINTVVNNSDEVVMMGVRVYKDNGETNAIMATFKIIKE